jgi:hypothetical protein
MTCDDLVRLPAEPASPPPRLGGDLVLDGEKVFLSDENLVTHGEVRGRLPELVPPLGLPGPPLERIALSRADGKAFS